MLKEGKSFLYLKHILLMANSLGQSKSGLLYR